MRPNQQNKNRSRGRNGGGRKSVNPLSRNFESNGPDVKIRGNAAHVAERYVQLARDAQATGDSVMAENYLQHAEHYFRILSAAQVQMQPRNEPSFDYDEDETEGEETNTGANAGENETTARAEAVSDNEDNEAAGETAAANAGGQDEDKAERPRNRRPRRRRQNQGEDRSDPGDAPQPDLPELPAFLTGGNVNAAE